MGKLGVGVPDQSMYWTVEYAIINHCHSVLIIVGIVTILKVI